MQRPNKAMGDRVQACENQQIDSVHTNPQKNRRSQCHRPPRACAEIQVQRSGTIYNTMHRRRVFERRILEAQRINIL